jgi:AcrR family transcriptional regulator
MARELMADAGVAAVAQRRRGPALEDAIRRAAYAELTAVGYTAFSVEAVAARARTGKASIYRRWPNKHDLVWDALEAELPSPAQCGLEFVFDDAMTTVDALHMVGGVIADVMTSPAGDVMRAIKLEAAGDPELAQLVDERFQAPRRDAMLQLLRRGVERGEVRPEAATEMIADVIPSVLMHRVLMQQQSITEKDVTEIIDQIVIPLVEVR